MRDRISNREVWEAMASTQMSASPFGPVEVAKQFRYRLFRDRPNVKARPASGSPARALRQLGILATRPTRRATSTTTRDRAARTRGESSWPARELGVGEQPGRARRSARCPLRSSRSKRTPDAGMAPRGAFHPSRATACRRFPAVARWARSCSPEVGASLWRASHASAVTSPTARPWSARVLGEIAERFDARSCCRARSTASPFLRWRSAPRGPSVAARAADPSDQACGTPIAARSRSRSDSALPQREHARAMPVVPRPSLPRRMSAGASRSRLRRRRLRGPSRSGAAARVSRPHASRAARVRAREHRYPPEQARFHMTAFLRGRARDRSRASLGIEVDE